MLPIEHNNWVTSVAFSRDGRSVLTGGRDGTARIQDLPTPVVGSPREVTLQVQAATGMMLDDNDEIRALSVEEWKTCRDLLKRSSFGLP